MATKERTWDEWMALYREGAVSFQANGWTESMAEAIDSEPYEL